MSKVPLYQIFLLSVCFYFCDQIFAHTCFSLICNSSPFILATFFISPKFFIPPFWPIFACKYLPRRVVNAKKFLRKTKFIDNIYYGKNSTPPCPPTNVPKIQFSYFGEIAFAPKLICDTNLHTFKQILFTSKSEDKKLKHNMSQDHVKIFSKILFLQKEFIFSENQVKFA